MERLLNSVGRLSRLINVIAGIAITFIMFLTVLDVILRFFRRPIVGTYELVAFSGAVVIGFAIPLTSWMRGPRPLPAPLSVAPSARRLRP